MTTKKVFNQLANAAKWVQAYERDAWEQRWDDLNSEQAQDEWELIDGALFTNACNQADVLTTLNPRFDWVKYVSACGYCPEMVADAYSHKQ